MGPLGRLALGKRSSRSFFSFPCFRDIWYLLTEDGEGLVS